MLLVEVGGGLSLIRLNERRRVDAAETVLLCNLTGFELDFSHSTASRPQLPVSPPPSRGNGPAHASAAILLTRPPRVFTSSLLFAAQ